MSQKKNKLANDINHQFLIRALQKPYKTHDDKMRIFEGVSSLEFFRNLFEQQGSQAESFLGFCGSLTYERVARGCVVYRSGETSNNKFYVVLSGEVAIIAPQHWDPSTPKKSGRHITILLNDELEQTPPSRSSQIPQSLLFSQKTLSSAEDLRLSRGFSIHKPVDQLLALPSSTDLDVPLSGSRSPISGARTPRTPRKSIMKVVAAKRFQDRLSEALSGKKARSRILEDEDEEEREKRLQLQAEEEFKVLTSRYGHLENVFVRGSGFGDMTSDARVTDTKRTETALCKYDAELVVIDSENYENFIQKARNVRKEFITNVFSSFGTFSSTTVKNLIFNSFSSENAAQGKIITDLDEQKKVPKIYVIEQGELKIEKKVEIVVQDPYQKKAIPHVETHWVRISTIQDGALFGEEILLENNEEEAYQYRITVVSKTASLLSIPKLTLQSIHPQLVNQIREFFKVKHQQRLGIFEELSAELVKKSKESNKLAAFLVQHPNVAPLISKRALQSINRVSQRNMQPFVHSLDPQGDLRLRERSPTDNVILVSLQQKTVPSQPLDTHIGDPVTKPKPPTGSHQPTALTARRTDSNPYRHHGHSQSSTNLILSHSPSNFVGGSLPKQTETQHGFAHDYGMLSINKLNSNCSPLDAYNSYHRVETTSERGDEASLSERLYFDVERNSNRLVTTKSGQFGPTFSPKQQDNTNGLALKTEPDLPSRKSRTVFSFFKTEEPTEEKVPSKKKINTLHSPEPTHHELHSHKARAKGIIRKKEVPLLKIVPQSVRDDVNSVNRHNYLEEHPVTALTEEDDTADHHRFVFGEAKVTRLNEILRMKQLGLGVFSSNKSINYLKPSHEQTEGILRKFAQHKKKLSNINRVVVEEKAKVRTFSSASIERPNTDVKAGFKDKTLGGSTNNLHKGLPSKSAFNKTSETPRPTTTANTNRPATELMAEPLAIDNLAQTKFVKGFFSPQPSQRQTPGPVIEGVMTRGTDLPSGLDRNSLGVSGAVSSCNNSNYIKEYSHLRVNTIFTGESVQNEEKAGRRTKSFDLNHVNLLTKWNMKNPPPTRPMSNQILHSPRERSNNNSAKNPEQKSPVYSVLFKKSESHKKLFGRRLSDKAQLISGNEFTKTVSQFGKNSNRGIPNQMYVRSPIHEILNTVA